MRVKNAQIGSEQIVIRDFRCRDLILFHFNLQMLNDKMLKPNNETCLQCKDQLKQITISREKMLQVTKSIFFEKWN